MKKIILSLVIIGLSGFNLFAQENESAVVSFLVGKVSVKSAKNSKWKSLKKDDKLGNGDTVMTGNGSATTLTYKGSEFKVLANSTLSLSSLYTKDTDGKVELKKGSAWFKLVDLGGKKFSAVTPTTVAGVRGTAFATLYDEKAKVGMNCVCEGKVEVSSTEPGSEPKMVEKGNGSSVKIGDKDIDMNSYKGLISKLEALPTFEAKVKEAPILKNCLSCHTPKGWKAKGIVKDQKYGK